MPNCKWNKPRNAALAITAVLKGAPLSVGFRFSLVFGSMTIAMGVSGLIASQFGVAPVIGLFGPDDRLDVVGRAFVESQ